MRVLCLLWCSVVVIATPGPDRPIVMVTDREAATVQGQCINATRPPVNFDLLQQNGFEIDWCKYEVQKFVKKYFIYVLIFNNFPPQILTVLDFFSSKI